ncbi:MAG: PrgI family protein [Candidatus Peribacteraceae bacterium]|nr:PrgI family protein [Candidatus Peribacteraceae bacterium]
MPIEPVKIPQNVYVEDRIVGPVTLRQLIIVLIGGGFSYLLYTTMAKAAGGHLGVVPTVLVWIPCAVAVIFAFVKVNDLSLFRIVLLMVEKSQKPPARMWTHRAGISVHIRTTPEDDKAQEKKKEQEKQEATAALQRENHIQELSTLIDRPLPVGSAPQDGTQPQPAPAEAADAEEPRPHFPVDTRRISADGEQHPDDLSAYRDVFRDISPSA